MDLSVEACCNLLARSSLLSPQDVKVAYAKWKGEAGSQAGQVDRFLKWLVAKQYVTDYQAKLIGRGQVDNFFLGQYKILDRIGQGRMAGIYKCVHRLGQFVAIKVLPPSKAKVPEFFTRFQREARMAMKLKHTNVVRTFQMAESGGLFYIVMEYLEGETLEDYLKRRPKLPPVEAVRIVYQALQGLQHIHDQQLVHRDLKPANLMLVPPPDASTLNCTVKILDIGLGRVMFDENSPAVEGAQLTVDGSMLGSPLYMAPEQARSAHSADIRADIYTLGCVLYHCLTGQPPFQDNNVVKLMLKHATEPPRPVRDFNPAIPEGLQQMVNWMLAKEPGQRFPTPDRAAASLQTYLAAPEVMPSLEAEPQMAAYLNWLDAEGGEGQGPIPAVPAAQVAAAAPVGVPIRPPPAGPRTPQPGSQPAAPAPVTARNIPPAAPAPAAARNPPLAAAPPSASAAPARRTPPGDLEPSFSGADVELVASRPAAGVPAADTEDIDDDDELPGKSFLVLGIAIGIGGALLIVVLGFLIYRLIG